MGGVRFEGGGLVKAQREPIRALSQFVSGDYTLVPHGGVLNPATAHHKPSPVCAALPLSARLAAQPRTLRAADGLPASFALAGVRPVLPVTEGAAGRVVGRGVVAYLSQALGKWGLVAPSATPRETRVLSLPDRVGAGCRFLVDAEGGSVPAAWRLALRA